MKRMHLPRPTWTRVSRTTPATPHYAKVPSPRTISALIPLVVPVKSSGLPQNHPTTVPLVWRWDTPRGAHRRLSTIPRTLETHQPRPHRHHQHHVRAVQGGQGRFRRRYQLPPQGGRLTTDPTNHILYETPSTARSKPPINNRKRGETQAEIVPFLLYPRPPHSPYTIKHIEHRTTIVIWRPEAELADVEQSWNLHAYHPTI